MIDSKVYSQHLVQHNAKMQHLISIAGLLMLIFITLPTLQVVEMTSLELEKYFSVYPRGVDLVFLAQLQLGIRVGLMAYFIMYLFVTTASKRTSPEDKLIQTFPFIVVGLMTCLNATTLMLGSALEMYVAALCVVFTFVVMPVGKAMTLAILSLSTIAVFVQLLPLPVVDRFDLVMKAVIFTGLFSLVAVTAYTTKTAAIDTEHELKLKNAELQSSIKTLRTLSATDSVTGIPNRREFDIYIKRPNINNITSSVILIDIDYFKEYNDTYGHLEGDKCLHKVANTLSSSLKREGDTVFRYGGEEFVAVLPNTDLTGALHTAERLRKAVEDLAIPHEKRRSGKPYVTISMGVATPTAKCDSITQLIDMADQNMYKAKQEGRNRIYPNLLQRNNHEIR